VDREPSVSPRAGQSVWVEYVCTEGNRHIKLGDERYFVNDETGTLNPTRIGQPRLVPEGQ